MGDSPIPTPAELAKDALKQLALEHGWPALKWAWNKVTENQMKKPKPKPSGSGVGALLLAAVVLQGVKKQRGRRR